MEKGQKEDGKGSEMEKGQENIFALPQGELCFFVRKKLAKMEKGQREDGKGSREDGKGSEDGTGSGEYFRSSPKANCAFFSGKSSGE